MSRLGLAVFILSFTMPAWAEQGLCTDSNKDTRYVKQGWCQSIFEALTKEDSCSKKLFDQMLKRDVSDADLFCEEYDQVKRDPTKAVMFYQNLLAAMAFEESKMEPDNKNNGTGLMALRPQDWEKCKKCPELAKYDHMEDPHINVRCGTYIALLNIMDTQEKEGMVSLYGGKARDKDSIGMSRVFTSMGTDEKNYKRLENIQEKMKRYCKSRYSKRPGVPQSTAYEPNTPARR